MLLFADPDPDDDSNRREDDEDGRARGRDGHLRAQAQHSRLAGVLLAEMAGVGARAVWEIAFDRSFAKYPF
ncbi:uncharacterized protein N7484_003061 [Penicillium longicatenatum]|uniref:uncharacterized protein n=1 Tax=Penicillium longicatenatum TaxID=1561947 RepID=UPI0025475E32|nr:uncharacterized protein N7484_003061 [Penicillium longicatenatum]KAJ5649338.1 hypothetical protein N7484_003061 [Penicillium longicatenatum]